MSDLAIQIGMIMLIVAPTLLIIGVPISVSMGLPAVIGMFLILKPEAVAITSAQRVFTGVNSFSLLAIPFFVLAGVIMNNGGIAKRMITFAKAIIGFIPGSLAQANIVANMFFGAVSGSGVAAAAAIGGVMGPIEKEEGYDTAYSAAVNTASAPCGMIIPPSNTFIVYSLASGGASVAALFGWLYSRHIVGNSLYDYRICLCKKTKLQAICYKRVKCQIYGFCRCNSIDILNIYYNWWDYFRRIYTNGSKLCFCSICIGTIIFI